MMQLKKKKNAGVTKTHRSKNVLACPLSLIEIETPVGAGIKATHFPLAWTPAASLFSCSRRKVPHSTARRLQKKSLAFTRGDAGIIGRRFQKTICKTVGEPD